MFARMFIVWSLGVPSVRTDSHTLLGLLAYALCRRDRDRHREKGRDRGGNDEDIGIKEANELRAKLGMKPLRP